MARPHTWSSAPVPLQRPNRTEFFTECVSDAIAEIERVNLAAFSGIDVGIEDVPLLTTKWSGDRVPMSAGLEGRRGEPAKLVVYQRPLEHRARSRADLRELVHRTIVEQLSAMTGMPIDWLTDGYDTWDG